MKKKREEKILVAHFRLSEKKALQVIRFIFQDILVLRDFQEGRS